MANLTLVVDEATLHRARVRAVQENTSVNAQVRQFLEEYSGVSGGPRQQAMKRLLKLSRTVSVGGGMSDRTWTRDDLHER